MTSRTTAAAVVLLVSGLLAGCVAVPPRTDASGWDRVAGQSLETAASEVAVVRRVLVEVRADRMPEPYARVMAVDSEESLGTAHDSVSGLQPPASRTEVAGRVDDLLSRADTLVGAGREALVAGDLAALPPLVGKLERLGTRLTAEMQRRRR